MKAALTFYVLVLVNFVTAQSLDWSGDVTLFGSVQNEHHPCLTAVGADVLHAFCVIEPDTLAMKHSQNGGVSWSDASKLETAVPSPKVVGASDASYTYILCYGTNSSEKHLYRFPSSASAWNEADELNIAPERQTNVACMSSTTDVLPQPAEPYLSLCWVERASDGALTTVFAQSRDYGDSFLPAVVVNSSSAPAAMSVAASIAVTWSGEEEQLHIAVPVDRPGSISEQINMFSSPDQGELWSAGLALDSSGYAQREPSLAAFGNTLFLTYSRRTDVTAQRNIFFTYSPDGGQTFAPPVAMTDSTADEFEPRITLDLSGQQFYLFYLVAGVLNDSATLMVRVGDVAAPWLIGSAFPVCESLSAMRSGGLSVAVNPSGVAAAWTSPFQLGDTDVHFDASWRATVANQNTVTIPSHFTIDSAYPNPFNAWTTVRFSVNREQLVELLITDVLGRTVATQYFGLLSPGLHTNTLNLSGYPSGNYWLSSLTAPSPPLRLILLK